MAPPKTVAGPSKRKAQFDDTRFVSAVAKNRYTRLFSPATTAIHECGLELDPESDLDRSMVATVDSVCSGQACTYTREIIRDFYKLLDVHVDLDCAYVALIRQPEEELNYDELGNNLRMKAELGSNPWKMDSKGQYNNLLLTNLSVTARAWLHFLSCRLLLGSHCTEVTKDRVLLINCLLTKQPIDAAQIIPNQLTSVAAKKLPSHEQNPSAPILAFPALITSLCQRAGVAIPPTEVPLKIIAPVSPARVARSGRRADNAGPPTTVASSAHYQDSFMKDLYERQDQYHRSEMATIERNHLFVVGELENLRRQGAHNQECLQVVHLHHNLLALIRQRDGTDHNLATRPFPPCPGGLH
ncbi:hypothetical protein G2W53_026118 [Senna tora]|uniref:Putative plant transposon protein domain-containing protein n=1 Tax=Senna tora TaxID=362788 RepID=A0A834TEI0_9FABA|nr:hypothetical protein G2W53_026118 [Senna tora]